LNSFIDDNNNKSNENYLSIFNCFLSTAAILVFICVKLTFISRLRKVVNRQPLVIQYSRQNNVYWTSNLLQRKEMWRVARQFIHTCLFKKHYWRKQIMSGTRRELLSLLLIDDRCELFIHKWVTEMQTSSSDYSLSKRKNFINTKNVFLIRIIH